MTANAERAVTLLRGRRLIASVVVAAVLVVTAWYVAIRLTAADRRIVIHDPVAAASPVVERPLRVLAYNIAHARGEVKSNWVGDRTAQLARFAELLRRVDADVVVLNEVDFDATWSGRINMARVLAEQAGYPWRVEQTNYDAGIPLLRWRFGNAVLSRVPILDAEPVTYPALRRVEAVTFGHKQGVVCTLDLGDGRHVRLLAVHLEVRSAATRLASARLIDEVARSPGPPLIAAGDFNAPMSDAAKTTNPALTWLIAQGRLRQPDGYAEAAARSTFPGVSADRLVDFVLAAPPLRITRFDVLDDRLSDHPPVVAAIDGPDSSDGQGR